MQVLSSLALLALLTSPFSHASDSKPKPPKPCTIISPSSGSFFDLSAISIHPLEEGQKAHKDEKVESWHARGYDYGANFTLNFCAPVVEELKDVVDVEKKLWRNVSGFYTKDDKIYSIGQSSTEPIFRGRKLVLNFTNGSPCDSTARTHTQDTDDDDDAAAADTHPSRKPVIINTSSPPRTKTSIISFLCDREPLGPKAHVAFVGASPDECTYFFETRSSTACPGVSEEQQTVGPAGVFGIILLIAAAVYLFGGIAYQRTVMHQRGWKQLPNYSMWAGIINFFNDILIILTSSCARLLPSRRGYNQLPTTHTTTDRGGGTGRGPSARAEDENRLIDQLDEEWDD